MLSPIDLIVVENRFRRDLGDLTSLRNSIFELGLMHPIVVDSERKLIAGQRRLEACKQLGWQMIEVNRVDTIDSAQRLLAAERDENTCRKEMTPLELKALVDALLEIERPRTRVGRPPGNPGPEAIVSGEAGVALDRAARAAGTSRSTYRRIAEVVDAASADDTPDDVRAVAVDQVKKLEAGETTPVAASRAVKEAAGTAPKPKAANPRAGTRLHNVSAHKAMNRVLPQLTGITAALASVSFDGVTTDEAAAWSDGLKSAVKSLQSTITKIGKVQ